MSDLYISNKIPINRRVFLERSLQSSLLFMLFSAYGINVFANNKSGGFLISAFKKSTGSETQYGVAFFNLVSYETFRIDTPFLVHSVFQKPNTQLLICTERHGPNICTIDFKKRKLIRHREFPVDTMLYGHCAFSSDGKHLIGAVSIKNKSYDSNTLAQFDYKSLEIIKTSTLDGSARLHDCNFITKDRLAVPQGNVIHIFDVGSSKIVKSHEILQIPPKAWIGHSYALGEKALFFTVNDLAEKTSELASSNVGMLDLVRGESFLFKTTNKQNKLLKSEILSLSSSNDGDILGTSSPWDNQISFWSVKDRKLVKSYSDVFPAGISFSRMLNCFVTIGNKGLRYFAADDLRELNYPSFDDYIKNLFSNLNWEQNRFYHSSYS